MKTCGVDAESRSEAEKHGALASVTKDATYFSSVHLAKLGSEDSECMALCAGALLGLVEVREKLAPGVEQAAVTTAVTLLLHPNRATRIAARFTIDAAHEAAQAEEEGAEEDDE